MNPRVVCGASVGGRMARRAIAGLLLLMPGLLGVQGIWSGIAAAAEIRLSMPPRVTNPNDTAELSLYLDYDPATTSAPSALIMDLLFDPEKLRVEQDYFELIVRDANGHALQDEQGHAQYSRSIFQVGQTVRDAEKYVESNLFAQEGRLRILIMGQKNPIAPGRLFTFVIRVHPDHQVGENLMIMGDPFASSVADPQAQPLDFSYEDAIIATGCEGPKAPDGFQAVSGLRNGVELSWEPVGGEEVSYRVYRSRENDLFSAKPLGEGWISGTAFMDYTALPADALDAIGCKKPGQTEEIPYYYWVRARRADGCPGSFTGPVLAARGTYKEQRHSHAAFTGPSALAQLGSWLPLGLALLLLVGRGRRRAEDAA